jgi:cytochrome c-type biogenesis protein CcmE
VARSRSPARLVVALSIAAALSVFLIYTSIAGGTPSVQPSGLAGKKDSVQLSGLVLKPITGDPHAGGMRFRLRDINGTATVPVVYTGTVGELFKAGRHILVEGRLRNGVFVAKPGSMITKCPSKYTPARKSAQE